MEKIIEQRKAGMPIPEEYIGELYASVHFSENGIGLPEFRWLCKQRPAEVIHFFQGRLTMKELLISIQQDMEGRHIAGYLEEGRWGLG